MLYFGILMITLIMVAATAILGRRIAELLPPTLISVGRFSFAPLFGIATVMLMATLNGWLLPFSVGTTALPVAVVLALCLRAERDWQALVKDLLPLIGLTVITSSTVLFPLLRYDTYNPFSDTFTYLVHSQWLQDHSFSEPATHSGFFPALTQVTEYQVRGHRMGASFFLAFVQAAFALKWSYYAYPATVALALTAGSLAVGGVVEIIRPTGRFLVLLIAAATATMLNGFAFGSFSGFLPQTMGLAMAVGALGLFGALITAHREPIPISGLARHTIPVALLFSALAYCYNDMLPFIAVAILFYFAALALFDRPRLPRFLLGLGILTAEAVVAVNYETVRIIHNFLETMISVGGGNTGIGWPVRWNVPSFVAHSFGFKSPYDGVWLLVNPLLTQVLCTLLVFMVVIGVTALVKGRQNLPVVGLILAVVSVFVLAFLHFRYDVVAIWPNEVGHSFLQFKTAKWVSPFISVLTGATVTWLAYDNIGRRRQYGWIAQCGLVALVISAVASNYSIVPRVTNQMRDETGYPTSSFNAFLDLRQTVADISSNQPIYLSLGAEHHKLRQMVAYILYDRRLASNYLDDGYLVNNIPAQEREMPLYVADWVLTMATPANQAAKAMTVIGTMALKSTAKNQFTLARVVGGYETEREGSNTRRWTAGRVRYDYQVDGKVSKVKLQFTHMLAGPPRHLRVTVTDSDSSILASDEFEIGPGWANYVSPPFAIVPGPLSVVLESDGEPVQLGAADPRLASFLVQNIRLQDADP